MKIYKGYVFLKKEEDLLSKKYECTVYTQNVNDALRIQFRCDDGYDVTTLYAPQEAVNCWTKAALSDIWYMLLVTEEE